MSGCMASAWMALLSIAKMNCLMMMLGLQCCLLCRDVCAACFWADVCGLTFGSVGERGSFGRYLRELPAPLVAMGQCLVALLVLGWHCCPLQTHDGLGGFLATRCYMLGFGYSTKTRAQDQTHAKTKTFLMP